jgi:acid stress-induced BolA-like protein IbaG/YrbA
MMDPKEIRAILEAALPGADVEVIDTTGTLDHFQARVVSAAFEGKSLVEQHQLVQRPLREAVDDGRIHALSVKTMTPEQWRRRLAGAPRA